MNNFSTFPDTKTKTRQYRTDSAYYFLLELHDTKTAIREYLESCEFYSLLELHDTKTSNSWSFVSNDRKIYNSNGIDSYKSSSTHNFHSFSKRFAENDDSINNSLKSNTND